MAHVVEAVHVLKTELDGYKDKANHALLNVENRVTNLEVARSWFGRNYPPDRTGPGK